MYDYMWSKKLNIRTFVRPGSCVEIRCCPKMSKDANGSTETIELRLFLT